MGPIPEINGNRGCDQEAQQYNDEHETVSDYLEPSIEDDDSPPDSPPTDSSGTSREGAEASESEERRVTERWLEKHGLDKGLVDARGKGREDKCLTAFASDHPKFRVTYGRGRGAMRLEVAGAGAEAWESIDIAELPEESPEGPRPGLASLIASVTAGQFLKPTPLDVTADWVTILLEPETWPGRLVAKSMGLLGRVVALHAGCPALVASWIGDAIERLCGQMVKVPEGARAVAAEDVEELTVACDLSGGYVTPEVVDFALRAEPEMRTSDRTPRQRP